MTGQSLWMMPTRSSPGMSAAVNTACTPGWARAAAGVDGEDVGPGVVGELAARRGACRRPGCRRRSRGRRGRARWPRTCAPDEPTPPGGSATGHLVGDERLDGVEDLHVPGAAAEVGAEVAGRLVAGERGSPVWTCRAAPWCARGCPGCRSRTAGRRWRRRRRRRRSRSSSSNPSRVVIDRPATRSRLVWQRRPGPCRRCSTVQQPHWPDGEQPSFGEVRSSSSRSAESRWGWSPADRHLAAR